MTRLHYATAALVFAAALALYAWTAAPSVAFVDSGLLTVAAWSGGNAHPPGFPLYLLLTKLATLIPLGSVARRVNLASALFGAAACGMTALAAGEALLQCRIAVSRAKTEPIPPFTVAAGMLVAGLLLMSGRTLWRYATIAEVYALNTFLIAAILWLMLKWRRTRRSPELLAAAGVFGLALGVHHVTVGLTLAGIAAFVATTAGLTFFRSRLFPLAGAVALAAFLAIYAYLPVAAARQPVLNWGDPSTLTRWWQHVTAAQFRSFINVTSPSGQVQVIASYVGREFGTAGLVLIFAAGGLLAMLRRDRALFLLLTLAAAGCFGWMLVYPIQNDRDAYLLPAYVATALAASYGAAALAGRRSLVALLVLALPVAAVVRHWPFRDRSGWELPRTYVENAMRGIAPNSMLLTGDEQLFTPLFYYQQAERLREDVRTVNWHLLMRWWYVDDLDRRHPALFDPVREELDAYRPSLLALRDDPAIYPEIQNEMNARFDELVLGMIREQSARGVNVYITQELAYSRNPLDQRFVRRLHESYDVVPSGIALAVLPKYRSAQPALTPIDLQGLVPATLRYENDDAVMTEVVPAYRAVLLLRGRHLAQRGAYEKAAAEYREALRLQPGDAAIAQELRAVESRLGR